MVLVAGDRRVRELAHVPDLRHDPTYLIVLLNRLEEGLIGGVDPVLLRKDVEKAEPHLDLHLVDRIALDLVGDVAVGDEEIRLVTALQYLKVLVAAVHRGARVHTRDAVEELVAAFDGSLEKRAAVFAGIIRHIVGRDID